MKIKVKKGSLVLPGFRSLKPLPLCLQVPGLQSHVAWQPRGALLATVQSGQGAKSPQVVLFERNGLRKGGFELETVPGDVKVRGMLWNASSELLGIALEWGDVTAVQVWYRSNYDW